MADRERRTRRVLRTLLRLYPTSFRETVGDDLVETGVSRWRERAVGGVVGRLRFWMTEGVRFGLDGLLERVHSLTGIPDDVRQALRQVRRSPGFHGLAIVTIALGIGATTAMFAVADAVVFRPLRYEGADELYLIPARFGGFEFSSNSLPNLRDLRASASAFRWLAGARDWSPALTGAAEPIRTAALTVTEDWLPELGARARVGRLFEPSDFEAGAGQVAVVGHAMWRTLWGGRDVLGEEIELNGVAHTIVGVMDRSYRDPEPVESGPMVQVWVPARNDDPEHDRGDFSFRVLGRLAPGTPADAARRQLTAIGARLTEAYPDPNRMDGHTLDFGMYPLKQTTIGDARDRLLLLLGASVLLLLLACANVASLFLTRGSVRAVELSIRSALGASRGRIARQLLTESIVIAAIGGTLGALLGAVGLRVFVAMAPDQIPRLWETTFDLRIAAFVIAATGLTGVAFGSLPALRSSRHAARAMRETRTTTSRRSLRAQSALVSIEVSLALVLVTGSALLLRSFVRLIHVDPGFDPDGIVVVDVRPPATAKDADLRRSFYNQLVDRLRGIAGVRYAALAYSVPGAPGGSFSRVTPDGPPNPELAIRFVRNNPVTNDWFAALGVPLRSGRIFSGLERADGIVINEAAARSFFPDDDSLVGRRLKLGVPDSDEPMLEVVGVVGNVRQALGTDPEPEIFLPYSQQGTFRMMMAVKLHDGVAPPFQAIRAAIRQVGPDVPIDLIATMNDRMAATTSEARFLTSLVTAFAALALLLAIVGTYATVSYAVSRRLNELGIRMALGARPGSVFRLVVLSNATAALLGVITGLVLTLFLSRYLEAYVFGITAQDPATVFLACALITAAATLAAIGPATRAARVQPNDVLRPG